MSLLLSVILQIGVKTAVYEAAQTRHRSVLVIGTVFLDGFPGSRPHAFPT
jgi:hypothetical protein